MNFNQFTIKAQEAVQEAVNLTQARGQQAIEPVHLLQSVMKVGENVTNFIFQKLGMNGQQIALVLDKQIDSLPKVSGGEPYLSRETNEIFQKATQYSKEMGDEFVSLEPMLLALLTVKSTASTILKDAGIKAKAHVFKGKRFIPDEKALGELMIDADRDCDLVVAVGTGSINDMCRFFSFQMGVPYAIVATAAPMDGFASSGAALIINSMKTTIPAQTPLVIIGDTDILCGAPARMVSAGLGDLLGKFTCLNDWRISKVVNDEYYCDEIVNLVTDCIENVLADADNVASRDPKVIGDIMEGLVLTGVAMSFIGNSRPAAGCEHHMCHFWETLELQEGKIPVLHGTKVAVGTVMILKMTEFLRENRPDFDAAREKAKAYDQAAWEAKINEVYGASASSIIALEHESQKNEVNGRLKRIDAIEAHWDEIVKLMDDNMPTAARMIEILKSLDAPYLPSQIGFDDDRLYNASVMLYNTSDMSSEHLSFGRE